MPDQARLAEIIPPEQSQNLSAVSSYPPIASRQEFEPETPAVPLTHYLWILRRHRWRIAAFVATCILATAVVSARLQPIYESTTTVDIDRKAPSEVVGQDSTRVGADDTEAFLMTQIKLIQSDSVLRPVAEQYHLLNLEGRYSHENPKKAQELAAAPVSLKRLKVSRPTGTYLLLISYRATDPRLAADVSNAIANSYLAHTYNIQIRSSASLSSFMEKQLDELKAKMEQSSHALAQFEKDLDVINPEEKTNILSARLLQLNTEYTNAQAQRVGKEAAWNAIRSGSVEAAQVSSQGESLAKLSDTLNQARQRFALVKATYGTTHPEYRKAASELAEVEKQFEDTRNNIVERIAVEYRQALNREQMLQKTVTDTKAEWDRLNSRSFEYQQLKREAEADKNLYDELIRKIRESDINAGFQNNNISIADTARPPLHPVFPDMTLNLLMALLASTLLAIGAAVLLDSIDTTLRDPQEASRFLGVDVIGTLPVDRVAAQLPRPAVPIRTEALIPKVVPGRNRNGYYKTTSDFEEAVRTLRNTILLSDFEGRLRSIVLTSATPSEGKTTMAVHLAIANADQGKKTLLVDADLRRPSLHAKFGLAPREGLSNVLTGEMAWRDAVVTIEGKPNLTLFPAGPGSHRAADLIGPRLSSLLDEFAKEYDLVILDSPPLLGFAECLQMATAADGVLIVARAGETRRKAVAAVVSVLHRLRSNIIGVVLNQVSQSTSSDGYSYYGYYRYGHYRYGQTEKSEV
ncbi:GumC family protein [Acidicapsa acidisoli]|uniref:GumC family protein n=1 Tax=Acidicapsa acidisoli TaxID=1615681 RepID=UPI0021DF43E6|nr:polysaccharide biosynthesis tyrosine autokinase [Acidicapsa acidisoli]